MYVKVLSSRVIKLQSNKVDFSSMYLQYSESVFIERLKKFKGILMPYDLHPQRYNL